MARSRVDRPYERAGYLSRQSIDLQPTAAPANLHVTDEGNGQVSLAWNAVAGAAGYNVYRSPVTGGGYVKVNADC